LSKRKAALRGRSSFSSLEAAVSIE